MLPTFGFEVNVEERETLPGVRSSGLARFRRSDPGLGQGWRDIQCEETLLDDGGGNLESDDSKLKER